MSEAAPKDVDAALEQMQSEAQAVADSATPADVPAIDQVAQAAADIAGDIEAATTPVPAAAEAKAAPPVNLPPEVRRLLAIEVPVIVQLGGRRMTVGEVMRLAAGAIIEINKAADDELDLLANNKPIGKGHAVKVGENFGIRVSKIGSLKEKIRKLGGQS